MRRSLASLFLVAVVLLASGCGGGSPAASPTSAPPTGVMAGSPTSATVAAVSTQDPSSVPEELASFPVPVGFTLVPDSAHRRFRGNVLNTAGASWLGDMNVSDLVAFFREHLANDFVLRDSRVQDDAAYFSYTNAVDSSLFLDVDITLQADVTLVEAELYRG